ncbi:MAG: hypothetical protein IPG51_04720 [Chloroflexi bacterium]|nr:hypothetical protein [Chloroflexota bacterium]
MSLFLTIAAAAWQASRGGSSRAGAALGAAGRAAPPGRAQFTSTSRAEARRVLSPLFGAAVLLADWPSCRHSFCC